MQRVFSVSSVMSWLELRGNSSELCPLRLPLYSPRIASRASRFEMAASHSWSVATDAAAAPPPAAAAAPPQLSSTQIEGEMRVLYAEKADLEIKLTAVKHRLAWMRGLHQKTLAKELQSHYGQEVPTELIVASSPDAAIEPGEGRKRKAPTEVVPAPQPEVPRAAAAQPRAARKAAAPPAAPGGAVAEGAVAAGLVAAGLLTADGRCQACENLKKGWKSAGCRHARLADCKARRAAATPVAAHAVGGLDKYMKRPRAEPEHIPVVALEDDPIEAYPLGDDGPKVFIGPPPPPQEGLEAGDAEVDGAREPDVAAESADDAGVDGAMGSKPESAP